MSRFPKAPVAFWCASIALLGVNAALLWGTASALVTLWLPWLTLVMLCAHGAAVWWWWRGTRNADDSLLAKLHLLRQGQLASIGPGATSADQAVTEVSTQVSGLVANVRSAAIIIGQSGSELKHHSDSLQSRVEDQAASLEQTSATLEQLATSAQLMAESAAQISSFVVGAAQDTTACQEAVAQLSDKVRLIIQGVHGMRDTLSIINTIAFQTKILALNAAIEASRAGNLGRGFAVVANEVRSLAIRCTHAAEHIAASVSEAVSHAEQGGKLLGVTGERMRLISSKVRHAAQRVEEISSATAETCIGIQEISKATQLIDLNTQQNAQLVLDISDEATVLNERAEKIATNTARYRLKQGTADEAMALVKRAIEHCQAVGLRQGMQEISAPDNTFRDRDLYVWAHDTEHRVVCISLQGTPRLGKTEYDLKDANGYHMVRDFLRVGLQGHGWVDYHYLNPDTGVIAPKTSYVQEWDEVVFGCGIYKPPEI